MSLIPYSGSRPSTTHPDALRTAQSLGRLARQLYNHWSAPSHVMASSASRVSSRARASSGSRGSAPQNRSDLSVRPPTYRIPSTVPKQVTNLIVWDIVKFDTAITTSTTSVVETNASVSLNNHPQVSSWTSLFDQWCVPQFSTTFKSHLPPGSLTVPCEFYTALDFDNVGTLGSIAAIEDFATCAVVTMGDGVSVTRSIRPCNKVASGTTNVALMGRQWVDSLAPANPWFAIRSMASTSSVAYTIIATTTIWFAFRNQI